MIQTQTYTDLRGFPIDTSSLDNEERRLIEHVQQFAKDHPDARTAEYENFWFRRVGDFYLARGLNRREITRTTVWQIAQDVNSRLLIAAGLAKRREYRDDLE